MMNLEAQETRKTRRIQLRDYWEMMKIRMMMSRDY